MSSVEILLNLARFWSLIPWSVYAICLTVYCFLPSLLQYKPVKKLYMRILIFVIGSILTGLVAFYAVIQIKSITLLLPKPDTVSKYLNSIYYGLLFAWGAWTSLLITEIWMYAEKKIRSVKPEITTTKHSAKLS